MIHATHHRSALAIVALLVLFSGCVAQRPVFEPDIQTAIRDTGTTLIVDQEEINATYIVQNSSAATAQFGLIGGLIGAVVDASVNSTRAKTAEERVADIRNAILGFDFETTMQGHLDSSLTEVTWLHARPVEVLTNAQSSDDLDRLLRKETGDVHLFVSADYSIDAELNAARVSLEVIAVPRSKTVREISGWTADRPPYVVRRTAIYQNTISYAAYMGLTSSDVEEREEHWIDNQGALLKKALETGINNVVRTLIVDLNDSTPDTERTAKVDFKDPTKATVGLTARSVKDTDDGKQVRWSDGSIVTYAPALSLTASNAR
ncbi:hypothetical protein [uncultured Abyssibacter sp.]|uniref:hypothetical protein n=1 Tax=uncultured Abyssibacter sp. TaxID=2320202 RepID=UPI0032B19A81